MQRKINYILMKNLSQNWPFLFSYFLFIFRYYIKLSDRTGVTQTLVKNQTNAVAIDYDWKTNCIFWSDVTSRGSSILKACNLTQTGNKIPEPETEIQHLGQDHVISTGHQMTNLVLNFK